MNAPKDVSTLINTVFGTGIGLIVLILIIGFIILYKSKNIM